MTFQGLSETGSARAMPESSWSSTNVDVSAQHVNMLLQYHF